MKGIFKSKARKAFLTAAISLALSAPVFAMPQGGEVKAGTVNITGVTTAANGTIDVTGFGFVDWNSFNLAKGETLSFILHDATNGESANLINRVVGQNMSEIYGHMISQGEGGVYLVNPNGILIGNGAQIDVGSLILSAGSFTETDPDKILNTLRNGGALTMKSDPSKVLKIDAGAKINFYDTLVLLGGKVQIADNVTISDGLQRKTVEGDGIIGDGGVAEDATLDVVALTQGSLNFGAKDEDGTTGDINGWSVTTQAGNSVEMGNATIKVGAPTSAKVFGHDIALTNTNVTLTDADRAKLTSYAANTITQEADTYNRHLESDDSNLIQTSGASLSGTRFQFAGGKVDVEDSTITTKKTGSTTEADGVQMYAGTDSKFYEINKLDLVESPNTTITVKGSTLDSGSAINMYGGQVTLDNNKSVSANNGWAHMFAGNEYHYDGTNSKYDLPMTLLPENTTTVKNSNLTATDGIRVFGGKIDISDSHITATDGEIDIDALNTYGEVTGGKDTWEATKDNTLTISGTTLTDSTEEADKNFIELQGGNVKLTDVTTDSTGIEIAAKSGYTEEGMDPNTVTHNLASDGMDVSISGGSITTMEDIGVTGKTITTNGTTFKAGENIVFTAGKDAYAKDDFNTVGVTAEADDLVSVTGGSLDAGKSIRMYGGTAKLDGVTKVNAEGYADVVAGAQIDYHRTLNETTKEYDDGYTLDATSANAITVKDSNVTAADSSVIYGGKIDVSGSTIENTGKEGEIRIDALNTLQESQGDNDTWKSTKDNAVTVSNTTLKNASTTDDDDAIEIEGGAVSLTGATVTGKNIYVASKSGYNETDTESHNYASDGMDTSVKDSTLTATGSIDVTGKTVTLDGATTLHAGNGMVVATGSDIAVKDAANGQGLPEVTTTDGTDVLVGKNVKLEGTQIVKPGTKTIGETPTEPTKPTTPTDPGTKPSEPTQPTTPTDPGTTPSEPTQPTTPTDPGTKPSEPTEPTTPNTPTTKDAAEVVAALEKSTTDEAKRAVIRAFEPTAEATEVAKQKQSEEASTENVQVASIEAQDVLPTTTESSTATVTVDGEAED